MPSIPIAAAVLAAATLFFTVQPTLAQPTDGRVVAVRAADPAVAERDPLDPRATVPPLRHRSALVDYRAAKDPAPTDWCEANDTTVRVGGWRAYAKQAQAPDATPAAASAAPSGASGAGHDGHHPR